MLTKFHEIGTAGDFFPNILVRIQIVTALIDKSKLYGFANVYLARIRYFLACNQTEQRRFTGAVRPDHTNDAALRNSEGQVFEQQLVTISFGDILHLDNLTSKTFGYLNDDLRFARCTIFLCLNQLVEGFDPRF